MNKLILILVLVVFFSCKKDNTGSTDLILAGINNGQNNIFKSYDSTRLSFKYNMDVAFFIDCDDDNVNDLEIINSHIGSRAGFSTYISKILPLKPSVKIAYEEMLDSIINFSIKDTATVSVKKYFEVDSVITFYKQNYNHNVLYPQNAKLEAVITKSPNPLEFSQIVDSELNWAIDTLTLSISTSSQSFSVAGKYLNVNTIDFNYGIWKNLTNKYIGLRINNRYGWLYLKVNTNEVVILTSLIEK